MTRGRVQSGKKGKSITRLWRLDVSRLEAGDVLLERAPTATSAVIRGATRGAYSHALIWMGNTDFMEAVGDGVRAMPYARIVTSDPKRWSLLRLDSDPKAAVAAATYARTHSFKDYNLTGAIASLLPTSRRARSITLFCSQLVAVAYEAAGIDLCPGKSHSISRRPISRKFRFCGKLRTPSSKLPIPMSCTYSRNSRTVMPRLRAPRPISSARLRSKHFGL
jgi:uncharacterized protein YycO